MEENKEKSLDTYSYRGWLNSDYFLKRVFAVLGYYTLGYLIIVGVFVLVIFIVALMGWTFALLINFI